MKLGADLREFIELLNSHKVEFIVVGAHALAWHGLPRYTKAIDFLVRALDSNAKRLLKALDDFGFGSLGLRADDFLAPNQVVQLGREPNRIDIDSTGGLPAATQGKTAGDSETRRCCRRREGSRGDPRGPVMIEFFDTTVLVAAMVEDEPHHESSAKTLAAARPGHAGAHSLAECYATLTGGRLGVQLSPGDAGKLVRHNVHDRLSLVVLSGAEYMKVVDAAGPAGARGGGVYDLLLLACARKVNAERIYTLNRRPFIALAPDLEGRIVSP